MATLEFMEIENHQKEVFKADFQTYLEEIDLTSGRPVNPDFQDRFPAYNSFFTDNPKKIPFRISIVRDPESPSVGKDRVGFFFLSLVTPNDFPSVIDSIYEDPETDVACLTHFYIYPNRRGRGLAWKFYHSIIDLATDSLNEWQVAWECDKNNEPAIKFYDKVLKRIKREHDYEMSKQKYQKKEENNRTYFFYQVKFDFSSE